MQFSIFTIGFLAYFALMITFLVLIDRRVGVARASLDKTCYLGFGFIAVAFVILRPIGIVADDYGYVAKYKSICSFSDCGKLFQSNRDYFWYALVVVAKSLYGSPRVVLFLSGISLSIKLVIIYIVASQRTLALFAYMAILYTIHDAIAFRVSMAESLYLLSLFLIAHQRYIGGILANLSTGMMHAQGWVSALTLLGLMFKPRVFVVNLMILIPLLLFWLGLYPSKSDVSFFFEKIYILDYIGEDLRLKILQIINSVHGDPKPVRVLPLVIPPALLLIVIAYNFFMEKETRAIELAYFSVGLSSLFLWVFAFNSVAQLRFFHFFFAPAILIIGNVSRYRFCVYGVIIVCVTFILKYNILHELVREPYKLYIPPVSGGHISGYETGISCGNDCYLFMPEALLWLAAQPDDDHHFLGWTQDCKNTKKPLCRLVVDSDKTIIPIFQRPNSVNGYISGNGRLFSDSKDLNCNVNCQASLDPGSTITLQAKTNPGYYVSEWLGSCAEASLLECTITTDQETHVVALTKPVDQHLLLVAKPEHARVFSDPPGIDCGRHSDQCAGLFDLVNLKLDLESGQGFSEWTGCEQNDRIECRLQMHDNQGVSVSTAITPEDGLRFLGPDLDVTGPNNKPDGIKDLHLQLIHQIEAGTGLVDGRSFVYDSSDLSKPGNGWNAKAERYRMVIHEDGRGLDLINDPTVHSEGGIIRYDFYIPYNDNEAYLAKGLLYKINIVTGNKEGGQSSYSYNVVLK